MESAAMPAVDAVTMACRPTRERNEAATSTVNGNVFMVYRATNALSDTRAARNDSTKVSVSTAATSDAAAGGFPSRLRNERRRLSSEAAKPMPTKQAMTVDTSTAATETPVSRWIVTWRAEMSSGGDVHG